MKEIMCPICSDSLSISIAKGRKSNKLFIMLKCNRDGRHFRGFITDQEYVNKVLNRKVSTSREWLRRLPRREGAF
jgi:hypothetical protein